MPRSAVLVLFVLLSGCSASTRDVVRLDTGQGEPIVHTPRRHVEPAAVSEEQFKQAVAQHVPPVPPVERPLEHARQLFGVPERSGWYRYEGRSRRLLASKPGNTRNVRLLPEDEELKRRYLLWCAQRGVHGPRRGRGLQRAQRRLSLSPLAAPEGDTRLPGEEEPRAAPTTTQAARR